jgi:hypothetical protein
MPSYIENRNSNQFEQIFFESLEKRIGFDVRELLEESGKVNIIKNHIDTAEKINTNTSRGGKKGRKGFNFEYLEENRLKNEAIKNGNKEKANKIEVLDNNDEIIDIKAGRKKLQLKNVANPSQIDYEKYVKEGAYIVVPEDYYNDYKEYINKKLKKSKTKEEKEFWKKINKKLKKSKITSSDTENPNLYLVKESIKDTANIVMDQYSERMKRIILSHMIKIFIKKVKEIYNDESKNYIEAIKEIFDETIQLIKEIWSKELTNTVKDIVVQFVKNKIMKLFKDIERLGKIFVNSLDDFIELLKKLFTGELSLKEFIRLGLKTIVFVILTTFGFMLEETIAEYLPIPFLGELIAIVLSVGIVSLGIVFYSEYIETALFGITKIFENEELLIEQRKTEQIKSLIENRLPQIIAQREQFMIEFRDRLNDINQRANESFNKLKDDNLSLDEFEKEFEKLGEIMGVKI